MTFRVLVVDDSAMMRALISRKLSVESDIEVVGTASNAVEARTLIKQLDPDVVTLDIEMPGMDGLAFLEKIMTLRPTPVIIVSGSTQAGTKATARALQLGAVDCYAKSTEERSIKDDDGGELAQLVREAAEVKFYRAISNRSAATPRLRGTLPRSQSAKTSHQSEASANSVRHQPEVIAIGSSTGGVEALNKILSEFPADCPPTLIVQHVNATFASAIAHSLNKIAAPRVQLADSDTMLEPGLVLVAPGGAKHLEVARAGQHGYRAVLREGELVSGHRPSVDRLFASVANVIGERSVGAILTGMGEDGAKELLSMARSGAHTIAQDRGSCVVFGMPRAAIARGAAKAIVPLEHIAREIFAFEATSQSNASSAALFTSTRENLTNQPQRNSQSGRRSFSTWGSNR